MEGGHPFQAVKGSERRPFIYFNFRLNIVVHDLHQVDELSPSPRNENKKFQLAMSKASEKLKKNAACGLLSVLETSIYISKEVFII